MNCFFCLWSSILRDSKEEGGFVGIEIDVNKDVRRDLRITLPSKGVSFVLGCIDSRDVYSNREGQRI